IHEKAATYMVKTKVPASSSKPYVPPGIEEFFIHAPDRQQPAHYEPQVAGIAKLHFLNSKKGIDLWKDVCLIAEPEDSGQDVNWEEGKNIPNLKNQFKKDPLPGSTFGELPSGLMQQKNYSLFAKKLTELLYQTQTFTIYQT